MATTHSGRGAKGEGHRTDWPFALRRLPALTAAIFLFASCTSSCLLASCIQSRPIAKIALIAPFEGLYRQTGYEALDAMRAAIADSDTGDLAMMPLALDGSGSTAQIRRATQKALSDPTVAALVGPFDPVAAYAVTDLLAADGRPWHLPFIPQPGSLSTTVEAIARQIENGRSLVLAGNARLLAALDAPQLAVRLDRPVRIDEMATSASNKDAVIWLGEASTAADALIELRRHAPDAPFWLAFNGDTPIFTQRMQPTSAPNGSILAPGPVYWTVWLDDGFEDWSDAHSPNSPTAYATYRATQRAISQITEHPSPEGVARLYIFQIVADGSNKLVGSHAIVQ